MRQIVVAMLAVLILPGCASGRGDATLGAFSARAWRNAPNQDPQNWSREPLLDGFPKLEQMRQQDRATIIARLGTPGTSYDLYLPGAGRNARIDLYRLSAKNDRVLSINYDANDRLELDAVEAGSCGCRLCSEAPPDPRAIVPMDVLARTVLTGSDVSATVTKGRVERLLGHGGRPYATTSTDGGQAWADYSEIWRIAGAGERYFIASGQLPVRDRETRQDAQLPITSYAIATVGPDCSSR